MAATITIKIEDDIKVTTKGDPESWSGAFLTLGIPGAKLKLGREVSEADYIYLLELLLANVRCLDAI